MRELLFLTIIPFLYLPIYFFAMGATFSETGRVHRTPNKFEPLIFAPFSFFYFILCILILKYLFEFTGILIIKDLCSGLHYLIQSITHASGLSYLLLEPIKFLFSPICISKPNLFPLVSIIVFYFLTIMAYPFCVGYYLSQVSIQRNLIPDLYKMLLRSLLLNLYLNERKKFLCRWCLSIWGAKGKLKVLITSLFIPLWGLPLLVFCFIEKNNFTWVILKFFTNSIIPKELEDVYNPNLSVVADFTLSDRKMVSGVLAGIELENNQIGKYKLESPIRWERTELHLKNQGSSTEVKRVQWETRKKKIPTNVFFIPENTVKDMNIYTVPHELFLYLMDDYSENINLAFEQIFKKLKEGARSEFIFSKIYLVTSESEEFNFELKDRLSKYFTFLDFAFVEVINQSLKYKLKDFISLKENHIELFIDRSSQLNMDI